jgi:hypothetical protein
MIAAESMSVPKRDQAGQPVSSWVQRWVTKLAPLMSGPILCLGLSLLGLAPLFLE